VICVTGATGFLGRALVRLLRDRGEQVRAVGRDPGTLASLGRLGAEPVQAAIGDGQALRRATADCALVYHLAGLIAYARRDRGRLLETNAEGTRKLLAAVDPGARVVHVSSVVTMGAAVRPDLRVTELDRPDPRLAALPYCASKIEAERYALEAARSGRDVVVVNPSAIFGPGDERGGTTWPIRMYLRGRIPFVTDGGLCVADVRDVAAGLVAAAERGKVGERYLLATHDGNLTHPELFGAVGALAGRRRFQLALPVNVVVPLSSLVRWPVAPGYIRIGVHWWFCDPSKAERELGYRPRPAAETLADTVRDILDGSRRRR
jgi:dihydroflavonol-4-reductase